MATTARQSKGARKGAPEPTAARRTSAWTGARGSPTYSPSTASPRQRATQAPAIQGSFPPLAQINGAASDNPRDRVLQLLSGLTGTTVTLQTKTSQRYEGVVGSTTNEGDTTGVTLKDVKDIANPGAPLKDQLFIASTNIESYTSGPADAKPTNGDSFRTDADISHKKGPGRERDLQAWVASGDTIAPADGLVGDDDTFGPGANGNTSWDQFTANETLFGVKASFDEDVYTTKLDRSAPDFKERERKAQRIANEIIGAATNNPHIAEERGFNVDDSGVNEEDKYGAVVRGQNAYVPPGARKTGAGPPVADNAAASAKGDLPKVSVNGPDGASVAAHPQSSPSSKAASPVPPASGSGPNPNKPPADPLPAFIAFVTNEKQRLTQKRQALVKSEMDKRMAELVKFSQDFKLNKPIPEDLVPILAKDGDKQQAIKEKASKDAASSQARAIGASNPTTASRGLPVATKNSDSTRKPITQALGSKIASNNVQASITAANAQKMASVAAASAAAAATAAKPAESPATKKISMVIQTIPPFKGKDKGKQNANVITTTSSTPVAANGATSNTNQNTTNNNNHTTRNSASPAVAPASPNTVANRLNVNASSFRPNPKVTPSPKMHTPTQASTSSPKTNKSDSAPTTPNPFFGTRPIKKSPPVHIKDDFNPFKHNKVVDAAHVATSWPYSGKRYMMLFPTPQHQPAQHPTHMAPPVPPPMPPPSYEEDSAAQAAAARGYVYAYPPYGYPTQHMMPGMPPPGPPGAYMPGPYMQPMPYPPGMPPPNAMYSPGIGQMPPPQGYMPPPGAYPPPPNGAGPRPSMPPTPIQANAHPYYHQSPQRMVQFDQYSGKMFTMPTVQHAYPMMMPPPPNIPPHGYEGGPPPVQMGGHS